MQISASIRMSAFDKTFLEAPRRKRVQGLGTSGSVAVLVGKTYKNSVRHTAAQSLLRPAPGAKR